MDVKGWFRQNVSFAPLPQVLHIESALVIDGSIGVNFEIVTIAGWVFWCRSMI